IRPNKVLDEALIAAFADLPRERFVPAAGRAAAYVDEDLHLGNGRFLMEPMVLARLLQAAAIRATDKVLDVGCTTGYAAAVMSRLAKAVVAVDSDKALIGQARETLAALSIDNVMLVDGVLSEGCPKHAPYQAILLDGAVELVPPAILDQLAEGG